MDFSSPFDLPNSFQANPNPMHAFFLRHGATSILTPEDSLSKSEHIAPLESSIGEEESKSQVATPAKESSEPAKESIEPSSSKENENAGPFKIKKASVPFNGVYLEFSEIAAADDYKVYVKGVSDSVWVRVDKKLLRNYGSYRRADVLGLRKGAYFVRIDAIKDGSVVSSLLSNDLLATSIARDGYAFAHDHIPGAYNKDGTLKDNAAVLYISDDNSSTITFDVQVDKKGKMQTGTGIQEILTLLRKGAEKRRNDVFFIGDVHVPEEFAADKNYSVCKGDLVLDGNNKYNAGITVEGVGKAPAKSN